MQVTVAELDALHRVVDAASSPIDKALDADIVDKFDEYDEACQGLMVALRSIRDQFPMSPSIADALTLIQKSPVAKGTLFEIAKHVGFIKESLRNPGTSLAGSRWGEVYHVGADARGEAHFLTRTSVLRVDPHGLCGVRTTADLRADLVCFECARLADEIALRAGAAG